MVWVRLALETIIQQGWKAELWLLKEDLLCVCECFVCTTFLKSSQRLTEAVCDALELDVQTVVSCRVGTRNQIQVPCKSGTYLLLSHLTRPC